MHSDKDYIGWKEYLVTNWSPHAISIHIRMMCSYRQFLQPYTNWKTKSVIDIAQTVWYYMNQDRFVEAIWPALRIVMGDNLCNYAWTSGVATSIALFQVIASLPQIDEQAYNAQRQQAQQMASSAS